MIAAANLFDRFGGIRPMAEKLRRPPSTIQSWKNAGRVPATEQPFVLQRADELGLDVTAADVVFPLLQRSSSEQDVGANTACENFDPAAETKRGGA